jgi:hypothetical protein
MADPRGFPCRHGKSRGNGGDHDGNRKYLLSPQQERGCAKHSPRDDRSRQHRLMIGCEIERNADAERDRDPRQQAPGPGLGGDPFAQSCRERRPGAETGRRDVTCPRRLARRPGSCNPLRPGPAPFRHPGTPNDPFRIAMLSEGAGWRKAERMRNVGGKRCAFARPFTMSPNPPLGNSAYQQSGVRGAGRKPMPHCKFGGNSP